MPCGSKLYVEPTVKRPHLRNCANHVVRFFEEAAKLKKNRTELSESAIAVAREYLEEHPADEDELADPEWINNLSRIGGDMSFLSLMLVENEIRLLSPCTVVKPEYVAPKAVTKGDIRKLCEVLGVILIESSSNK